MAESNDEMLLPGGTGALPRFLATKAADGVTLFADEAEATWTTARKASAGFAGCVALLGSAFLAPEGTHLRAGMAIPEQIETVGIAAAPAQASADVEQRLTFAEHLGSHLAAIARLQEVGSVAVTPLALKTPLDNAEPEALFEKNELEAALLLIVHNLPEGATFSDGVAAGIGSWAIGGQDPEQIVAAIEDGIDEATTVEVELIAPSGATLESRAVDLPAKPRVAGEGGVRSGASQLARATKAESKPLGPKRRVAVFKRKPALKVAEQGPQTTQRRKRRTNDAYRAQAQMVGTLETGNAGVQERPPQEEGAWSKFLSMFNGSGGGNGSAAPKAVSREYDSSLRGLGMSPPD